MRHITIIGAGQSGLLLGIGLLKAGYRVTIVSNRTGEEIARGRITSSQCMFDMALEVERRLDVDFWHDACPDIEGIGFILPDPAGGKALDWAYRLDRPAQSVDQRVKMPRFMQAFEELGGALVIHDAELADLDRYRAASDLVIVASGKGDIGRLFERDAGKSAFDKPMRALGLTYVHGMEPHRPFSRVSFNLIPGVGEYFVFPALTHSGPCEIMVFEGIPGGPMDCWGDVKTPAEHLTRSKWILDSFVPWEAERCRHIELTDGLGTLSGRFAPTIRKPVAHLPSGAAVMGMADALVLNDPITGQGSNNAAKCANIFLQEILAHGDRPYDEAWMQRTFDRYWDYARWVVGWTNGLLLPPPEHVVRLLQAAQGLPAVGRAIVNGFNDPTSFFPWFADPQAADRFLAQEAAAA